MPACSHSMSFWLTSSMRRNPARHQSRVVSVNTLPLGAITAPNLRRAESWPVPWIRRCVSSEQSSAWASGVLTAAVVRMSEIDQNNACQQEVFQKSTSNWCSGFVGRALEV